MKGAACCARQRRDEGLPRESLYHLRAVPMLQLAGDQCSSWHPFLPSQGGSDLCLAPVALQGLSHPVTSLIPWPSPTISTQAWFWAEMLGLLCLYLAIPRDPSYIGGCKLYGRQNICVTCELINKTAIGSGTEHVCPWQLRRGIPNPRSLRNKTDYH